MSPSVSDAALLGELRRLHEENARLKGQVAEAMRLRAVAARRADHLDQIVTAVAPRTLVERQLRRKERAARNAAWRRA